MVRATIEICRLMLALRLYRDRHGAWPARLDQLAPDVLESLPEDPLGSGPFRYARLDGNWVLWSAGARRFPADHLDGVLAGRHPIVSPGLACTSNEAELGRLAFKTERERSAQAWMTPQVMRRYGLTPPGP